MSEAIPESIPTSADPRSRRPVKKARRDTPLSAQHAAVERLFEKQPDIQIPTSATRPPKSASSLPPPPEIVANVQGSSAGAGSGEFHVYKASRRREQERLRLMDEESKRGAAEKDWVQKQAELKKRDEEKLGKNQKKRLKAKQRKDKAGKGEVIGTRNAATAKEKSISGGHLDRNVQEGDVPHDEVDEDNGNGLTIHDDD